MKDWAYDMTPEIELDLVLYGVAYTDENGERIDPTTVVWPPEEVMAEEFGIDTRTLEDPLPPGTRVEVHTLDGGYLVIPVEDEDIPLCPMAPYESE